MKPLHYTASALALGLALMGNAQAVTTIPFWHSMEGELGKEVDSLAQRFNAENPDYKIVPTYKGNYEQNLSAGIAALNPPAAPFYCAISTWKVYRGSKLPAWAWCAPSSMCVCSVK